MYFEYLNVYGFRAEGINEWGCYSNSSGTIVSNLTLSKKKSFEFDYSNLISVIGGRFLQAIQVPALIKLNIMI